jgi:hypothetical protein
MVDLLTSAVWNIISFGACAAVAGLGEVVRSTGDRDAGKAGHAI